LFLLPEEPDPETVLSFLNSGRIKPFAPVPGPDLPPLILCIQKGWDDVALTLVDGLPTESLEALRFDLDPHRGLSLLHIAVWRERTRVRERLMDRSPDLLLARDNEGHLPWHLGPTPTKEALLAATIRRCGSENLYSALVDVLASDQIQAHWLPEKDLLEVLVDHPSWAPGCLAALEERGLLPRAGLLPNELAPRLLMRPEGCEVAGDLLTDAALRDYVWGEAVRTRVLQAAWHSECYRFFDSLRAAGIPVEEVVQAAREMKALTSILGSEERSVRWIQDHVLASFRANLEEQLLAGAFEVLPSEGGDPYAVSFYEYPRKRYQAVRGRDKSSGPFRYVPERGELELQDWYGGPSLAGVVLPLPEEGPGFLLRSKSDSRTWTFRPRPD